MPISESESLGFSRSLCYSSSFSLYSSPLPARYESTGLLNVHLSLMSTISRNLQDLPLEVTSRLPEYLHSLDDWYALIQTSRYLYDTCSSSKAKFPSLFRVQKPLTPHPHFVLAGCSRQIADWATDCAENYQHVCATIPKGNAAMLKLVIEVARWSVEDVRALHRAKVKVVLPVYELLKNMGAFKASIDGDKILEGVVYIYSYLTYCELFHRSIDGAHITYPPHV